MLKSMISDEGTWNTAISTLQYAHILQSYRWGEVKSLYGWTPYRLVWEVNNRIQAAAGVLERTISIRRISLHLRILYVPKGPLLIDWKDQDLRFHIIEELKDFANQRNAIFIKIDPDVPEKIIDINSRRITSEPRFGRQFITDLQEMGWRFSKEQIQFRNTILIDLGIPEEELLSQMKPKTRYNIRLAQRKGVKIRIGNNSDLGMLYRMYAETAKRDKFTIRDQNYYRSVWGKFLNQINQKPLKNLQKSNINNLLVNGISPSDPIAEPLIAEVNGEPVAAVIYYRYAKKAWYLYGMSLDMHREKMPNYLLQWEAMRRSISAGCETLDFWGAPEAFDEKDSLYGVYRFKAGFGGRYVRHIGAWDYPVHPFYYHLYMELLPKLLSYMRIRARGRLIRETA